MAVREEPTVEPGLAERDRVDSDWAESDFEPYRRELTGYCYRMLGSGFEAEDAVQEAMVRAWRNADGFEGRSSLRSWLYRIATNVCIDMHRQVQRRARPMEMGPASPPDESQLGPMLPEATWVTPIADASVAPDGTRPGRDRRLPGVDPARVRHRAAAPAGPPAGRPHPLRGAALAGRRGGRAARHDGRGGQQRAPAGPGHARGLPPGSHHELLDDADAELLDAYVDAFERYDIERLVSAAARGRRAVDAAVRHVDARAREDIGRWMVQPGPSGLPGLAPRRHLGQRVPGLRPVPARPCRWLRAVGDPGARDLRRPDRRA